MMAAGKLFYCLPSKTTGFFGEQKLVQCHYLQRTKLMQPSEFGHFSYKELLAQRKIVQRAIAKNRDIKKVHRIVSRINDELDERRKTKLSYASKHMPKINFND